MGVAAVSSPPTNIFLGMNVSVAVIVRVLRLKPKRPEMRAFSPGSGCPAARILPHVRGQMSVLELGFNFLERTTELR